MKNQFKELILTLAISVGIIILAHIVIYFILPKDTNDQQYTTEVYRFLTMVAIVKLVNITLTSKN